MLLLYFAPASKKEGRESRVVFGEVEAKEEDFFP